MTTVLLETVIKTLNDLPEMEVARLAIVVADQIARFVECPLCVRPLPAWRKRATRIADVPHGRGCPVGAYLKARKEIEQ